MKIRLLPSRPASLPAARTTGSGAGGQRPPLVIVRRTLPYWEERGWWFDGHGFSGRYQTRYGAFLGWITRQASGEFEFCIYEPPEAIKLHSHWVCFREQGTKGWYVVHMAIRPKDASSGIIAIEHLLSEALSGSRGGA